MRQLIELTKTVWIPALITTLCALWPITFDYAYWVMTVALVAGFLYQCVDGLFLSAVRHSQTAHGKKVWKKMEEDEELWSWKLTLWITMGMTVFAGAILDFTPLVMFLSLCVLTSLLHYIDYTTKYNDDLEDPEAF